MHRDGRSSSYTPPVADRPKVRFRFLAGAVGLAVIVAAAIFWVNRDEIAHDRELSARFDCPDLIPPLPSSSDGEGLSSGLTLQHLADAEEVTALAVHPITGDVFIAEKAGRLLILPASGGAPSEILDLRKSVRSGGTEQGLLGVAFALDGSTMYLHYTDRNGDSAVEARTAGDREWDHSTSLFSTSQPYPLHNGGALAVDSGGSLWITLGDGGGEIDRHGHGQDPKTLLGSILRFDPAADGLTLRPAADNPFVGSDDGADEVWAYGLRNPWRIWIDDAHDRMVIGDVGDNCFEEINVIGLDEGGANFGWRRAEGPHVFDPPGSENAVFPRFSYPRGSGACAVIGGVGADDTLYPELEGAYLFTDLCAERIFALDLDGSGPPVPTDLAVRDTTTFAAAPDGTIYVGSYSEGVFKLLPRDR